MSGVTQYCLEAAAVLLMGDRRPSSARLVSCKSDHAFIFIFDDDRYIVIKDGFASGYDGEGARGLAAVLRLLEEHRIPTDERTVPGELMERLGESILTGSDWEYLLQPPDRETAPSWRTVFGNASRDSDEMPMWHGAPLVLPAAILDPRLQELAVGFWKDPDACLMKAHRRLEHEVRVRTGLAGEGARLFTAAFRGADAPLKWPSITTGEREARANLFCGSAGTYRNPHMHTERERTLSSYLSEFLLVNELFRLEGAAQEVTPMGQDTRPNKSVQPTAPSGRGG